MTRTERLDKIMSTFSLRKGEWVESEKMFCCEAAVNIEKAQHRLISRCYILPDAFDDPDLMLMLTDRLKTTLRLSAALYIDESGEKTVRADEAAELFQNPNFRDLGKYFEGELIDEGEIGTMDGVRYFVGQ
jgi:hypothetical protein